MWTVSTSGHFMFAGSGNESLTYSFSGGEENLLEDLPISVLATPLCLNKWYLAIVEISTDKGKSCSHNGLEGSAY